MSKVRSVQELRAGWHTIFLKRKSKSPLHQVSPHLSSITLSTACAWSAVRLETASALPSSAAVASSMRSTWVGAPHPAAISAAKQSVDRKVMGRNPEQTARQPDSPKSFANFPTPSRNVPPDLAGRYATVANCDTSPQEGEPQKRKSAKRIGSGAVSCGGAEGMALR